ncbi:MAG: sigma-70 family RNA polymerase sigma factor [Planctomycetota bacterium]
MTKTTSTTEFVTQNLSHWEGGSQMAMDRLYELTKNQLQRVARYWMGPHLQSAWGSEDVLHVAWLKFQKTSLADKQLDAREFFRLSSLFIKRTIIEIGRRKQEHQKNDSPAIQNALFEEEPSEVAAQREAYAMFEATIDALPADMKEIVRLSYYQGLSNIEIAELVGMTPKTVGVKKLKCQRILEKVLRGNTTG